MSIIVIIFLLGIIPCLLGIPWTKIIKARYSLAFAYSIGYFIELAIFHLITCISVLFGIGFRVNATIYTILLLIACVGCGFYSRHFRLFSQKEKSQKWKKPDWLECILLLALIFIIGLQVIRCFTYDITTMSYDDSVYTTIATDALETDTIGQVDPYTGTGIQLDVQRTLQTSLVFPAFLSLLSGLSVTIIEHTVQHTQMLLLAYSVYIYLAGEVFEKRENRLIFLLIISFFYFFGLYSHYSLTFRMLGPNYQGKAILAVSLTPLILTILSRELFKPYCRETGMLLVLLSLGAVSLTMWGAGTLAVTITLPVILSQFSKTCFRKNIMYIVYGLAMPGAFFILWALFKFLI